ncbi:Ref family recombination enhancement nuclease [Massilia sp. METH4]|uniref:Ref family recombination enhancement nuclease n=1 Tax=Massilia sp. METH4 TaxID=3123041 RepID=UPI0030CEA47A
MPLSTLNRSKPMRRTGFKSATSAQAARRPMKSKGMKGRAPTAEEARLMHAIGGLGCIACLKDGIVNPWISLHHIDGRTKPGAHLLVLPLCAPHHQQDDSDPLQRPSVHGRKATFTARYGTELELHAECLERVKGRA